MSHRDRRQLKARIEQHRLQATPKIASAPTPAFQPHHDPARLDLLAPSRPDVRPLSVEYVALRLHEALIRKEGRSALEPGVVLDCVSSARLMLQQTRDA